MRYLMAFMILVFSNLISAHEVCNTIINNYSEIYQEETFKNGVICIYIKKPEDQYATITFFKRENDRYNIISSNLNIFEKKELERHSIFPSISNINDKDFQILFSYPNTNYVVNLTIDQDTVKIKDIFTVQRMNYLNKENEVINLTFRVKSPVIKELSFEKLDFNTIFNAENLELDLEKKLSLKINTDKSYLYDTPDYIHKTKMYLIQDDWVDVINYKNDWIFISYKTSNNKIINKWVPIIDVT